MLKMFCDRCNRELDRHTNSHSLVRLHAHMLRPTIEITVEEHHHYCRECICILTEEAINEDREKENAKSTD
jgi:hypothetical protein